MSRHGHSGALSQYPLGLRAHALITALRVLSWRHPLCWKCRNDNFMEIDRRPGDHGLWRCRDAEACSTRAGKPHWRRLADDKHARWITGDLGHGGRATERHLTAEFKARHLLLPRRSSARTRRIVAALDAIRPPGRVKRALALLRKGFGYLTLNPSPRLRKLREDLERKARTAPLPQAPPARVPDGTPGGGPARAGRSTRGEHVIEVPAKAEAPKEPGAADAWEAAARATGHRP